MRPTVVIVMVCVGLLAGCAVGPNYHTPQVSAPTQWTSPLLRGETNGPADLADWWKNFDDTNLDSLMTTAIQSNLTLRVSLEPDSCVRRTRNLYTRYGVPGFVVAKFIPGLNTLAPPLAGTRTLDVRTEGFKFLGFGVSWRRR